MMHKADKVIFVNNLLKRLELLRQVDGIYCEYGHEPTAVNADALLAVRKPLLCWTPGLGGGRPIIDDYFQRHLYFGVYPTAPYPGNQPLHQAGRVGWTSIISITVRFWMRCGEEMGAAPARRRGRRR